MIEMLVTLLILVLVFGILWYVFTALVPLPPPFGMVARAIIALIFVLVLIGILFGGIDLPMARWRHM
jgi:hypothetical protein